MKVSSDGLSALRAEILSSTWQWSEEAAPRPHPLHSAFKKLWLQMHWSSFRHEKKKFHWLLLAQIQKKESWKCRDAPSAQDFCCWLLFVFFRIQNLPLCHYLYSKLVKSEFSRSKMIRKESWWKMEIITWQLLCVYVNRGLFFFYRLLNITDLHSLETFRFIYFILLPCFCCLSCQTCWR